MSEKRWTPANVFDVFGDRLSRQVLVLASERPVSAQELSDYCEVAPSTIYRRTDELRTHDLLRERSHVEPDGTQYKVYETTLERITFGIEDGGYTVDVEFKQSLADGFEGLWSGFESVGERSGPTHGSPFRGGSDPDI